MTDHNMYLSFNVSSNIFEYFPIIDDIARTIAVGGLLTKQFVSNGEPADGYSFSYAFT